jgi:histidyl-tRNA synthetase
MPINAAFHLVIIGEDEIASDNFVLKKLGNGEQLSLTSGLKKALL